MKYSAHSLDPVVVMNSLMGDYSRNLRPEHTLSLVEYILRGYYKLDPDDQEIAALCIGDHYDLIREYARSSTVIRVKMVASDCALLLGNFDDAFKIYSDNLGFTHDDSFFQSIDYFVSNSLQDQASKIINTFWSIFRTKLPPEAPLDKNIEIFLKRLTQYAFLLNLNELAHEIIRVIEKRDIDPCDPEILSYRTTIVSPSEFYFALPELISLVLNGKGGIMTPGLLSNMMKFVREQIQYIEQNKSINPSTLEYLLEEGSEYDFHANEGLSYFHLEMLIIGGVLLGDEICIRKLLALLWELRDTDMIDCVADICVDLNLISEDEYDEDTPREIVITQTLFHQILKSYSDIEYKDIQELTIRLCETFSGGDADFLEWRKDYRQVISGKEWQFSSLPTEIKLVCLKFRQEFNPVRRNVIAIVARASEAIEPQDPDDLFMYILEHYLVHIRAPNVEVSMIQEILENPEISYEIKVGLTFFYPNIATNTAPKISAPS